jgi:hypothetical protein
VLEVPFEGLDRAREVLVSVGHVEMDLADPRVEGVECQSAFFAARRWQ